jgi:hypothetical protein
LHHEASATRKTSHHTLGGERAGQASGLRQQIPDGAADFIGFRARDAVEGGTGNVEVHDILANAEFVYNAIAGSSRDQPERRSHAHRATPVSEALRSWPWRLPPGASLPLPSRKHRSRSAPARIWWQHVNGDTPNNAIVHHGGKSDERVRAEAPK